MHGAAVPVILIGLLLLWPAMPAAAAVVIEKLTARPIPARSAKGYPQEFEFEVTIKDRGMSRILGCDTMLEFGDGTPDAQQHFMDGGARKTLVRHVYEAPGTYSVVVRGRAVVGGRACDEERRAQVTVIGEPPAPEGSAAAEAPPPTIGCPAGWSLVPGSQSGYRFKCRSERTTPKIECQGGTKYFEQDGMIGCQ
jgi:hypothetical protein